jgi:hypothetical protein
MQQAVCLASELLPVCAVVIECKVWYSRSRAHFRLVADRQWCTAPVQRHCVTRFAAPQAYPSSTLLSSWELL